MTTKRHIQNVVALCERLQEELSEYIDDDTPAADLDGALVFPVQLKDQYRMSVAETKELTIKMLDCLD
jgi:hypothetical protein